jgi:ligand-binding sensor domain-containing protein/signal transduction histidine kinase
MLRRIVLTLVLAPFAFVAFVPICGGAPPQFFQQAWQMEDGLPENGIRDIAQTPDGYLWVATARGLARFDGVRFTVFSAPRTEGIEDSNFLKLFVDRRGELWAGSPNALTVLRAGRFRSYTSAAGLFDEAVAAIAEARDGSLWIGAWGATLMRFADGQFTAGPPRDLPRTPSDLFADSKGDLWLACRDLLARVDRGQLLPVLEGAVGDVQATRAAAGGLWVVQGGRLQRYEALRGFRDVAPIPEGIAVRCILEDRQGGLWLGTQSHGALRFHDGAFHVVETSHSSVVCLFEDREGSVWIGTEGGGLSRVRERVFTVLDRSLGLPADVVSSLAVDADGTLWCVTGDGAVSLWRRGANRFEPAPVSGFAATCVAVTPDNVVWFGTDGSGLFRLTRQRDIRGFAIEDGLPSAHVSLLLVDRRGRLLVGGSESLMRLEPDGSFRALHLAELAGAGLRCVADDGADGLWIGMGDGRLIHWREAGSKLYDRGDGLPGDPLRSLSLDAEGSLWIGTHGGGLARWRAGRIDSLGKDRGLLDDAITQVEPDGAGALWCGSPRGIFRVQRSALNTAFASASAPVEIEAFGRSDGFASLRCSAERNPRTAALADGRVALATHRGVMIVDPARLSQKEIAMPLIEEVVVDGRVLRTGLSRADGPPETLPSTVRSIEIHFTSPALALPDKLQFRYRLLGLNDGWTPSNGRRSAAWHHLPPGSYQFEIQARTVGILWQSGAHRFDFCLEPRLWETWWFRALGTGLCLAATILGARRIAHRRLRARLAAVEAHAALQNERIRLARDMHDELGASLNEIALLGGLAQSECATPEKVQQHAGRIVSSAQRAARSLDEIVWAVNPRNDTVPHFVEYAAEHAADYCEAAELEFEFEAANELPDWPLAAETRHHLLLAIKETLHNIVKHARARRVTLSVCTQTDRIIVNVADDGHGLPPQVNGAGRDGLINLRERLASIGGDCRVKSEPGLGTSVTFSLPVPMSPASSR